MIGLNLNNEDLATTWSAQYGTGPTGPWTDVNSGEVTGTGGGKVSIGVLDHELEHNGQKEAYFLRGLKPGTSYYARFVAKNSDGEAEKVIPFKTLPVGKPEIDRDYSDETEPVGTSFEFSPTEGDEQLTDTTAWFVAKIDANGAQATYRFEYAEHEGGPWKEFTSGASGTVGTSEEYAWVEAGLSGLTPEREYFVRVKASNEKGETVQAKYRETSSEHSSFQTLRSSAEVVNTPTARNVTSNSAYAAAVGVSSHGWETEWRLEYAEHEAGPWSVVPGAAGTISQAQAQAQGYFGVVPEAYGARLTGLSPSTTYYLRDYAKNTCATGCGSETSGLQSFTTGGKPSASALAAHGVLGGALRLLGSVETNSEVTSDEQTISLEGAPTGGTFTLSFDGHSTAGLAYNASPETVRQALEGEGLGGLKVGVEGPDGGPYTVWFIGTSADVSEPQIGCDALGLVPVGAGCRTETTQAGGVVDATAYHFEYVSQSSFAEHGWTGATQGPEAVVDSSASVALDLPALVVGETYRYRLVVHNEAGFVESPEETLTVPAAAVAGGEGCANETFRTGISAHLPDCRAYELVTPVDKNGAQEPFVYAIPKLDEQTLVAEDGEHTVLEGTGTDYLTGPLSGQTPYLFSREEGAWSMLAGSPQPATGVRSDDPQVYSADLTSVALYSEYNTSTAVKSADVEYD
ncbi:MAG TPA: fibronectin type III domain-containing protein, partial [Solirubrobacteraceae bacterium]|nr:fibronectin type III domain-containing protein [Solirubrobacteraceae bacterium]